MQLFAPFSVGVNRKGDLVVKANTAEAEKYINYNIQVGITATPTDKSVRITTLLGNNVVLNGQDQAFLDNNKFFVQTSILEGDKTIKEFDEKEVTYSQPSSVFDYDKLEASKTYKVKVLLIYKYTTTSMVGDSLITAKGESSVGKAEAEFNTAEKGSTTTGTTVTSEIKAKEGVPEDGLMKCDLFNMGGCIANIFYYLFFKTTSFVFGFAGKIMDFTLMYSVSDSSYRSNFIAEGWQVVRDFCNMFFIFVLLYIAFKTILGIDSAKTKGLIINVVAVGLLINFSLFVTHVIIDTSNILARVFYNNSVMITGTKNATTNEIKSENGDYGEIKLSETIVTLVNPVKLISQANNVGTINSKANVVSGEKTENISSGNFLIVVILASAVNIVGIVVFLSLAFALVGRVISLWVAMILAPIAFFSYTMPFLQGLPMVGSKNWWKDLLSAAFMAPVLCFFLYLIVGFMEKGLGLNDLLSKEVTGISKVVSITVPFILIMVLLMKAKEISVKMSGMAGEMMAKAGSAVGGMVAGAGLAAVTGGASMALRGTIGKAGASIANSEKLKEMEKKGGMSGFAAKSLRNFGSKTGEAGFDFRNTKLGATANGAMGKELGIDMGKGKVGGYQGSQDEIAKKQIARADTLKMSAVVAAKQDADAKEYKKTYNDAMYKDRAAFEKEPSNKGKPYIEKDFEEKYKKKFKDDERKEEKKRVESKGGVFDAEKEKKFNEKYDENHKYDGKTSDEVHKERIRGMAESITRDTETGDDMLAGANKNTKASIIKDLKAKGKEEKKEVTAYDKYKAQKKIDNADVVIEKADNVRQAVEKELEEINKTLEAVAKDIGGGLVAKDVTPEHIKKSVEAKQDLISDYEADMARYNAQLKNDPDHPDAKQNLAETIKNKKKAENEINRYNSVLSNKEKAIEKKDRQEEITNNQLSIKAEQQDIIDGK